jgi:hypothetical protein
MPHDLVAAGRFPPVARFIRRVRCAVAFYNLGHWACEDIVHSAAASATLSYMLVSV